MTTIAMEVAVGQLAAVLREGFEGPAEKWSYFTDNSPEAGLFGTLTRLSAEEVSRPWGGTSIAAHVGHLVFSLDASTAWISGRWTPRDWKQSWRVSTVDDVAWAGLLDELRAGYDALRRAVEEYAGKSLEAFGGAAGAVAHTAYHLGAIRQKVAAARQG